MLSMNFRYFTIILRCPLQKGVVLYQTLIPFTQVFCAKFGWDWSSGFWEKHEHVKILQTDGRPDERTTGDQNSLLGL